MRGNLRKNRYVYPHVMEVGRRLCTYKKQKKREKDSRMKKTLMILAEDLQGKVKNTHDPASNRAMEEKR